MANYSMVLSRILRAGLAVCVLAAPAAAADFTTRSGGPSSSEMMVRNMAGAADGLAFVRPVLSGVLYRAGFKGGDKARTGLSSPQRSQLCNQGFSSAFYADFGKLTEYGQTSCASGSLDYAAARSSRPANVMKAVYDVIGNPDKGPVLVHVGRAFFGRVVGYVAGPVLRLV